MSNDEKRAEASQQLRIARHQMKLAAAMLRDLGDWRATQHANELDGAAKLVRQWATEVMKP